MYWTDAYVGYFAEKLQWDEEKEQCSSPFGVELLMFLMRYTRENNM